MELYFFLHTLNKAKHSFCISKSLATVSVFKLANFSLEHNLKILFELTKIPDNF